MRNIKEVIIHCSATVEGKDFDVNDIDRWHRDRGWNGCGYHYVIKLDGTIQAGRPLDKIGAHTKGRNQGSIGICYIGGVDENIDAKDTRTEAQKISMQRLVSAINVLFGGNIKVYGHREFAKKACPSFEVKDEFSAYR